MGFSILSLQVLTEHMKTLPIAFNQDVLLSCIAYNFVGLMHNI